MTAPAWLSADPAAVEAVAADFDCAARAHLALLDDAERSAPGEQE